MKSLTYYFHVKTKILTDFHIYISVPLSLTGTSLSLTDTCYWYLQLMLGLYGASLTDYGTDL